VLRQRIKDRLAGSHFYRSEAIQAGSHSRREAVLTGSHFYRSEAVQVGSHSRREAVLADSNFCRAEVIQVGSHFHRAEASRAVCRGDVPCAGTARRVPRSSSAAGAVP
jgi:hypothetical protein